MFFSDSQICSPDEKRCSWRGPESPTQSTITLLNTAQSARVTARSLSSSSASMHHRNRYRQSTAQPNPQRTTYQLNGLFHQPSLKSICIAPSHATASRTSLIISKEGEQQIIQLNELVGFFSFLGVYVEKDV